MMRFYLISCETVCRWNFFLSHVCNKYDMFPVSKEHPQIRTDYDHDWTLSGFVFGMRPFIQNIRIYNMLSLTHSCGCEMLQPRQTSSLILSQCHTLFGLAAFFSVGDCKHVTKKSSTYKRVHDLSNKIASCFILCVGFPHISSKMWAMLSWSRRV